MKLIIVALVSKELHVKHMDTSGFSHKRVKWNGDYSGISLNIVKWNRL